MATFVPLVCVREFWKDVLEIHERFTLRVLPNVLLCGLYSLIFDEVYGYENLHFQIPVGPHEAAGAFLGVLLVLRTNAGYERWWEARKAWGGIVNQSRNLAIAILAYGPRRPEALDRMVRWSAAFCHASRASLRDERHVPELVGLLGPEDAARVEAAPHMPNFVALEIGEMLREACEQGEMDRFGFLQADREKAQLIDHIGVCERIRSTPLARAYTVKIRRLIVLYLFSLPFALENRFEVGEIAFLPTVTMIVAYIILSLDQIGDELQQPFATSKLSHHPLDQICAKIEANLLDLLRSASPALEVSSMKESGNIP